MKEITTAVDWIFYGFWSVAGQTCLWGLILLVVWLGWDITLVDWLNADHFVGRESALTYAVAKVFTAFHIVITIALLLLEWLMSRKRAK